MMVAIIVLFVLIAVQNAQILLVGATLAMIQPLIKLLYNKLDNAFVTKAIF